MSILEQLPESETREELMQRNKDLIDETSFNNMRTKTEVLHTIANELLGERAVLGDQTRELLDAKIEAFITDLSE